MTKRREENKNNLKGNVNARCSLPILSNNVGMGVPVVMISFWARSEIHFEPCIIVPSKADGEIRCFHTSCQGNR